MNKKTKNTRKCEVGDTLALMVAMSIVILVVEGFYFILVVSIQPTGLAKEIVEMTSLVGLGLVASFVAIKGVFALYKR